MLVNIPVIQTIEYWHPHKKCDNIFITVRPAPGSDQEQLDEEAGLQDLDGDSPPGDRGDGQSHPDHHDWSYQIN